MRMTGDYELDILQWGKNEERDEITLSNVSEIYEPEQDKGGRITYKNSKFSEIPEWLFSKKVTSRGMSKFYSCERITSIPENLFKNNVNVTNFYVTFIDCRELLYIPNTIIEHAKRVKEKGGNISVMFKDCIKASNYNSLPEYMK